MTDALLFAVNTYTRAWTAFHDTAAMPNLADRDRQVAARRSALDFAWWYRHTGRTPPSALLLAPSAEARAAAHAAVAMIFLLAHKIGHIVCGHLELGSDPAACLEIGLAHTQEFAADLVAESILAANPPAETNVGESVRILFELLELLELVAAGTPGDEATHPLAMRRLLPLTAALDKPEHDRLIQGLQTGREHFWLLRT